MTALSWLTITRREAPLLVSIPHTGTDLAGLEPKLVSPWLARKDTDWRIEDLYDFAAEVGATIVWPPPYEPAYAAPTRETLRNPLLAVLAWARRSNAAR